MPEQKTLEHDEANWPSPIAYVDGDSLGRHRIVAIDCLEGQVAFTPPRELDAQGSNVLALTCLGYTALQTGDLVGLSGKSIRNELYRMRALPALTPTHCTLEMVGRSFSVGILHTTQTAKLYAELSVQQHEFWQYTAKGLSERQAARRMGFSVSNAEKINRSVLTSLGVQSRVTAALYSWMLRPPKPPSKLKFVDGQTAAARGLQAITLPDISKKHQSRPVSGTLPRTIHGSA